MPSLTPKQHRAMEAAAHGHSTLGIPKSVGADFVAADKTSYNDDHHADAHIANAHPHQSHSERHHAIERTEVNPGKKAWNAGSRHITDSTPIGGYTHHIHDRRDMDPAHMAEPHHPHHRKG